MGNLLRGRVGDALQRLRHSLARRFTTQHHRRGDPRCLVRQRNGDDQRRSPPTEPDHPRIGIGRLRVGRKIAGLQSVAYPTQPHGAAKDTDIVDLVVIEFAPDVTATFFKDTAYILDSNTATTSQLGDQLYVAGALKEKVNMGEGITPGFCCIEFVDSGNYSDPTLREAH